MKIIFLDIDGVLNGYNFWNMLGWRLVYLTHSNSIKNWYRRNVDVFGVHERKVKRLSKIVEITGAKVVMSSSWRHGFWNVPYDKKIDKQKQLTDMLTKYNIEVIDITPTLPGGHRGKEIKEWLDNHIDIDNYVILGDERFDIIDIHNDKSVQTSSTRNKIITGHWTENARLKHKHVRNAIKILNR